MNYNTIIILIVLIYLYAFSEICFNHFFTFKCQSLSVNVLVLTNNVYTQVSKSIFISYKIISFFIYIVLDSEQREGFI